MGCGGGRDRSSSIQRFLEIAIPFPPLEKVLKEYAFLKDCISNLRDQQSVQCKYGTCIECARSIIVLGMYVHSEAVCRSLENGIAGSQ